MHTPTLIPQSRHPGDVTAAYARQVTALRRGCRPVRCAASHARSVSRSWRPPLLPPLSP